MKARKSINIFTDAFHDHNARPPALERSRPMDFGVQRFP